MIQRQPQNLTADVILLQAMETWLAVQDFARFGSMWAVTQPTEGEVESVQRYGDGSVRITVHLRPSAQPAAREKTGAPLADLGMRSGFAKEQRNAGTRKLTVKGFEKLADEVIEHQRRKLTRRKQMKRRRGLK